MRALTAVFAVLILATASFAAFAQTSPDDPAIQKAKEETAVVFDLARFFGYLKKMEEADTKLALSKTQLEEVYTIMKRLEGAARVEPADAEKTLIYLEDKVLKTEQLVAVDQLAIAREQTATTPQGGGDGGLITSYIAGGPFNPMTNTTRTMGKDFADYLVLVAKRLGK